MTLIAEKSDSTKTYSEEAHATFATLDHRVADCFQDVKHSKMWSFLSDKENSDEAIVALLREIFRSVGWYQAHTTEAGFHMFGRLPKRDVALIRALCSHKAEEAEHGVWAVEDHQKLGGTSQQILADAPSPATFAVAAVWWRMAMVEDPLGYLGAEYLFEKLTALVTPAALEIIKDRRLPKDGLRFVIEHATEDQKHASFIKHLILDVVTRYPGCSSAMLRCYDYFAAIYPLPVWDEACARAIGH